jgi:hypothetical protein
MEQTPQTLSQTYSVRIRIVGTTPLFYDRQPESYRSNTTRVRGSKVVSGELAVIRNKLYFDGPFVVIPSTWIKGTISSAAKSLKGPGEPYESALDLYRRSIRPDEESYHILVKRDGGSLSPVTDEDYIDYRLANKNPSSGEKSHMRPEQRPCFRAGWECEFTLEVEEPELILIQDLNNVLTRAGRLIGIGNNRTHGYGRFMVTEFAQTKDDTDG